MYNSTFFDDTWEQQAGGEFTVDVVGENHCGPNHSTPKTFTYLVVVRYPLESLDERGFLVDNLNYQSYFDSLKSTDLSCERLVKKCAHELMEWCEHKPSFIRVTLWAFHNNRNYAKVKYTLREGRK